MRIASKKDLAINLVIWSTIFIILITVAVTPAEGQMLVLAVTLPSIGLLLWIYYGTYYELMDTYLYAKSGPFSEKIAYESIVELKLANNLYSSMALSRERILVRTTRKGLAGLTYISPENREEFLAELKSRCRNLRPAL